MDEKGPKKKGARKFSFEQEMEAVLEKHGYVDWAVAVRSVDGVTRSFWSAGDGENPSSDVDRGMLLFGFLGRLQGSILDYFRPKTTPL